MYTNAIDPTPCSTDRHLPNFWWQDETCEETNLQLVLFSKKQELRYFFEMLTGCIAMHPIK